MKAPRMSMRHRILVQKGQCVKAGGGEARLIRFEVRHTFSVLTRRADHPYAKDLRFTFGNLDKGPEVDAPAATMSI